MSLKKTSPKTGMISHSSVRIPHHLDGIETQLWQNQDIQVFFLLKDVNTDITGIDTDALS